MFKKLFIDEKLLFTGYESWRGSTTKVGTKKWAPIILVRILIHRSAADSAERAADGIGGSSPPAEQDPDYSTDCNE